MSARIVSLSADWNGVPYLAKGSPHAYGDARLRLYEAIRPDLSVLRIEPAPHVNRRIPPEEPSPHPESCRPYVDANGLGFVLRPRLPLLFVRTPRGELLPDARTALAYARENEAQFADILQVVERHAPAVLDPGVVARHAGAASALFRDLVQPYGGFVPGFISIAAGLYAITGPGIGTVIGPPLNQVGRLAVQTGLIETDWHHHALFVVIAEPRFEGRALLIMPEEALAQVYFVAYRETGGAVVEHAAVERGGEPAYETRWWAVAEHLAAAGRRGVIERTGIASITLECLHCRLSVTDAADADLPADHVQRTEYVGPYKHIQRIERRQNDE
ncbi:MAG: hypothetical protein ACRDJE_15710 [Dehalococcoidia bacterium]